jgi:small subunit ribosomal protein S18
MANNFTQKRINYPSVGVKQNVIWNQSLDFEKSNVLRNTRLKKSLQYILFFKEYCKNINYTNIKLLSVFLTKHGKIQPRRKTRISTKSQRLISRAIRKARAVGILPYQFNVKN